MRSDEPDPASALPGSYSSQGSPPAGDRVARQAQAALRQHAQMFEALGMKATRELENRVFLEDDELSMILEYGLRRRLLSRIYNLRASTEVASPTSSTGSPYRPTLKTSGLVNASFGLTATGPAGGEGRAVADRVASSGVLDELAGKVDLENLSIAWVPEAKAWRVVLEPYPGSYIHVLLPPIRYTVRLKEPEVSAIRAFLVALSDILKQSGS